MVYLQEISTCDSSSCGDEGSEEQIQTIFYRRHSLQNEMKLWWIGLAFDSVCFDLICTVNLRYFCATQRGLIIKKIKFLFPSLANHLNQKCGKQERSRKWKGYFWLQHPQIATVKIHDEFIDKNLGADQIAATTVNLTSSQILLFRQLGKPVWPHHPVRRRQPYILRLEFTDPGLREVQGGMVICYIHFYMCHCFV